MGAVPYRTDGRTTTTAYTPATGIPAKTTTVTPPADGKDSATAQTTTTELDPLRGLPAATVDTNGKRTTLRYDALGRSWMVYLADRASPAVPTYQFNYFVEEGKPTAVATRTLNPAGGTQTVSYTLYDGYLRARQTQVPGPDAGRLISDTFYDERGLTAKSFAPYYTTGKPARDLFKPENALSVETQTWNTYDGLGRTTESRQVAGNGDGGKVLAVTSTLYGGDRTTVIPPEGATATTTVTNARGKTTELLQHHTRAADAPAETTRYAYTPKGELAKVADPAGNSWTYTYDQAGNQTQSTDPDRGTSKATFDDRGQQTTTTDSRGTTLATAYDGLGRKTELRDKALDGPLRAKWVYDTVAGARGQLSESTRYIDGKPYTNKITQYDRLYRPQRMTTVIPDSEGKLAGSYEAGTLYYGNGLVRGRSFSTVGNILGKGWNYNYDDDTMRTTAVFGSGFRADPTYNHVGQPLTYKINSGGLTQVTNTYEFGTQRLSNSRVDRLGVAGVDQSATYGYDPAGNITAVSDVSRSGTDTQCFTYDFLRRLTEAWTQNQKTCADAPAGNLIAGPAPYWQSYAYDAAGNRRTLTQHDPAGDAAKDTKSTYTYPKPGTAQPHSLTAVDTTGPTGTAQSTYGYDPTGNTIARTLKGDKQTLDWDAEGHLAKVTEPTGDNGTKTTSYLYDADGNRLIARTGTKTTLYLGDHTELTLDKDATTPKATRYIPLGGGNQAVLTDDGAYTITLADHHGTGQLAIKSADQTLTQRRSLPFGGPRGDKPPTWPGSRGFVGGTDDTADTGLTHLGAREYDPEAGRFLSVDPVMDLTDPQQINGYTYSNNNPTTFSDPSGKLYLGDDGRGYGVVQNEHGGMRLSGSKSYVPGPGSCIRPYCHRPSNGPVYHDTTPTPCYSAMGMNHCSSGGDSSVGSPERSAPVLMAGSYPQNLGIDRAPLTTGQKIFVGSVSFLALFVAAAPLLAEAVPACLVALVTCAEAGAGVITGGADGGSLPTGRLGGGVGGRGNPCNHSFLPGAEVALADGKEKNIEDIKTGDKVIATDPGTGKTTIRPVVATIVTKDDKHFTDLTVRTPSGDSSIIATDTHPFWSVDKKKWINAGDLHPGTELRTPQGATAKVTAARHFRKQQQTHDLTVEGTHTYYVLAGSTPILVHNSNCARGADGRFLPNPSLVADARYARVTLRSPTKAAVQRAAPRDVDGNFIDPNTGQSIPADGPFHYGHKPGFEYWRSRDTAAANGWTRDRFIEYENDPSHYQIEDPYNNLSHQYEQP